MAPVIETLGLTKYYGKIRGVEDLSLSVEPGQIFGVLGPNGAGKSTTIRVLLDFIRPTSGTAHVFGITSTDDPIEIHRRVGYLPGELALYDTMTGDEMLRYFGALRNIRDIGEARRVADLLELDLTRLIGSYSSGNRQKLGLAQAFLHRPELLILDEPTNGLDPLIQQAFYRLAEEARDEGRTIFLSSHILPEVERIAERVGIIRDGRLVTVASVTELKRRAVHRLEIRFAKPVAAEEFAAVPGVRNVTVDGSGEVLNLWIEGSVDAAIKTAAQHEILNLISHEGDLEEAFLAFYSGSGEQTDAE